MSARGEYICISCWTSFESLPDDGGFVTCPHCGFTQPASDDGEATVQTAAPRPSAPRAPAQPPVRSSPLEPLPIAPGARGPSGASAITMSPRDMDSLEELVAQPSGARSLPEAAPDVEPPPPARTVSVPITENAPAEPSAPPVESGPRIWRLKSDAGLTYCFFEPDKLMRWVDGLGPQKNALVSVDGVNWKTYADFKSKFESDGEALSALESASEHKPVAAPSLTAPTVAGAAPGPKPAGGRGPASPPVRPAQPTRQGVRPKPNPTGERRAITTTGERPAELGLADASPNRRPPSSATGTHKAVGSGGWGARIGFMAAGMVLGGAGVYFGLYLMGYYDLVMPF